MWSLRGKRFRLINSSSLHESARAESDKRKYLEVYKLCITSTWNSQILSFLENVNCKAIGSDVFSSGPTKLVILNEAERAVKRIIKAEVYNQGVKREAVEASGVEQSSCDARV